MGEVKYINVDMAVEALQKGLRVWRWSDTHKWWEASIVHDLTFPSFCGDHFAIGEKPTSPPRKMIEIDGVRMPAPIVRVEDFQDWPFILFTDESISSYRADTVAAHIKAGNAFATEADAIAARDARKLILERAMERAK